MTKPKFETSDGTAENIAKLAELFPGVITEGKVNVDALRTYVGEEIFKDEAYEFTWVGKREAVREAGRPIRKTLRPCPEESKNWDTTENLYIEGGNLDVLKLLQESYLGKVKMIYIDPPYNTGNDFIYRDNFTQSREDYEDESGMYNEEGDRLFKNTETNGRFHSDWCSMMYPRLVLARNLLSNDGVIFISIDDNEVAQLRKICDEVFGESNFVTNVIWQKKFSPQNDAKYFSQNHDNILCYAKSMTDFQRHFLPPTEEQINRYQNPDNDPRGVWTSGDCSVGRVTAKDIYPITTPSARKVYPSSGRSWSFPKENMEKLIADNRIWFGENGDNVPRVKRFFSETNQGLVPISIWYHDEVGHTQSASQDLKKLFDDVAYFDYPKPVGLIRKCLQIASNKDSIILDFFSGSSTTAHAVMQLNAEDMSAGQAGGGKRKFIMVQLPEACDEKSEAAKAGYRNICEIGKERIRRAGEKIVAEKPLDRAGLDIGFRVLKLDDTNMEDVYYAAGEYTQEMLKGMASNIKSDRSDMDLLFGCLLDWGLPLSLPHTQEVIDACQTGRHGTTIHTYNDGDLIACFADNVSESVVKEIAKRQPLRVVFRDSSFTSSPEKINVEEIFKHLAPNTKVRVI